MQHLNMQHHNKKTFKVTRAILETICEFGNEPNSKCNHVRFIYALPTNLGRNKAIKKDI